MGRPIGFPLPHAEHGVQPALGRHACLHPGRRTTAQVAETVREAVRAGLRVTVRAGGHCYEDFVSGNHGGVIIDMSQMHGVSRSADGTFWLEGGCTNWDVYTELYKRYDATLPSGSCYSVGLGGHVAGPGYGLLSRQFGLTVDYLTAVELVVVNRDRSVSVVTARPDDSRTGDLLWEHRRRGRELRRDHAVRVRAPAPAAATGMAERCRVGLGLDDRNPVPYPAWQLRQLYGRQQSARQPVRRPVLAAQADAPLGRADRAGNPGLGRGRVHAGVVPGADHPGRGISCRAGPSSGRRTGDLGICRQPADALAAGNSDAQRVRA